MKCPRKSKHDLFRKAYIDKLIRSIQTYVQYIHIYIHLCTYIALPPKNPRLRIRRHWTLFSPCSLSQKFAVRSSLLQTITAVSLGRLEVVQRSPDVHEGHTGRSNHGPASVNGRATFRSYREKKVPFVPQALANACKKRGVRDDASCRSSSNNRLSVLQEWSDVALSKHRHWRSRLTSNTLSPKTRAIGSM